MARITLSDGFLPPLGTSAVLQARSSGQFDLSAYTFDRLATGKLYRSAVDMYGRRGKTRLWNGFSWVPVWAVEPLITGCRLKISGNSGAAQTGTRALELFGYGITKGPPMIAKGTLLGDRGASPEFGAASALSGPVQIGKGYISPLWGPGPYELGYRWLFKKSVTDYALHPYPHSEDVVHLSPRSWTLELEAGFGRWFVVDQVQNYTRWPTPYRKSFTS